MRSSTAVPRKAPMACARRICAAPTSPVKNPTRPPLNRRRSRSWTPTTIPKPNPICGLRQRISPPRMHHEQRLLRAGQPERRNRQSAVSREHQAPRPKRKRSAKSSYGRTIGQASRLQDDRRSRRMVARDVARHRDGPRDLPELPHRPGGGRRRRTRPGSRRGHGRATRRRRRGLELVGRAGTARPTAKPSIIRAR